MTCADLPLFAFSAHGDGADPSDFIAPFRRATAPRGRQPKPPAPKGAAIWPRHDALIAATADVIVAAIKAARQSKPKPPAIDPLIEAIRANIALCRAVGQPEAVTPATDVTAADTGAAFVVRTDTALEIIYRGPRDHLEAALSAISADRANLPVMARCAAAQLLPLRSASVARGVCGWRAIIPIRPLGSAPTLTA